MTCRQCGTHEADLETPRRLRTQRDREYVKAAGFRLTGTNPDKPTIAWIPRYSCRCQYRARLRMVAEDLLPLIDHPDAGRELRRREGLNRHLHKSEAA